MSTEYSISVILTTYNHEAFIAQAIEGILGQEINCSYEILIGEDCSTDRTREIVMDYEKRYPERIRAVLAEKNEGGHANFSRLYRQAQGKYVAWLEGDDYWTNPHKLQKQVDFLENNPDFAICFHNMRYQYEDAPEITEQVTNPSTQAVTNFERLCRGNYIYTASSLFRNKLVSDLPAWVYPLPVGDWPFFLLIAQHGKICFMEEVMGVYRVHSAGAWMGQRKSLQRLKDSIYVAEVCRKHFDEIYGCHFKNAVARWSAKIINHALYQEKDYVTALRHTLKMLQSIRLPDEYDILQQAFR